MNKTGYGNYIYYFLYLLLPAVLVLFPGRMLSQGYLKSALRSTNCEVSSHEADRWYFGQNAGLDFRPDDPEADPSNARLNVPTSPAVTADSLGNILFYTDGAKVYNRYDAVMPNGDGLHGYPGYTMPALIVPRPGSDSIYYIFTTHACRENPDDPRIIYGFEYNEVRLNREGGAGDVTVKNKQLLPPEISSKLTAVKHENGIDYWIITHRFNSTEFDAFLVTSAGVDTMNYRSTSIGTLHTAPDSTNNAKGYMKASPDGTKIALAIYGSGIIEIFDFDPAGGTLSNAVTSLPVFDAAYGIEFSSDSRYLYATTTPATPPQPSYLYQFDTYKGGAIFNDGEFDTIASDILGSSFAGLQLGTDGKIYVTRSPYGNASLSVIRNPKRPWPECNFQSNALDLQGKKNRLGFPNFIQSYFDLPHFNVENVCYADTTYFSLQNNSNIDDALWEFTDTNNAVSLTGINPRYVFSHPGSYEVKVTEYFNDTLFGPYTETVIVNELPIVDLRDTVYMYPGSPILLDAGAGFTSYLWSTEENTQQIIVSDTGIYYVTVQNERCCLNSDAVVVLFFDVFVPNAFRPGGVNSIFKAYSASPEAVTNFTMYIYNRWGQQVYVIKDIHEGWDGRISGKDAPGDVYVWMVSYDIERKGRAEKITYKGNVILLR